MERFCDHRIWIKLYDWVPLSTALKPVAHCLTNTVNGTKTKIVMFNETNSGDHRYMQTGVWKTMSLENVTAQSNKSFEELSSYSHVGGVEHLE